MIKVCIFLMDIVYMNKGFSMLEMLICMFILTAISTIALNNNKSINLEHFDFLNNYLSKQTYAYVNKQDINIKNNININSMGHVNQARTIDFDGHSVIIHLGNGYATYQ